ncbi:MAG: pilin [bacterium]|nr:pilin [bacterium]
MDTPYQLLEKTFLPGDPTTVSSFGEYASAAFQTVLMVVIVLAVLMLTISGLQYIISPAAGGKEEATKRIWAAIIGLLIALSSYLILKTINPNLVGASLDLGNIGNITAPPISPPGSNPNIPGGPPGGGGGIPTGPHTYPSGVGLTEDDARNQLAAKGIQINGPPCGGQTYQQYGNGCTNLDGIPQESVDEIIAFKNVCNCLVVVNGATEAGHSTSGTFGLHAPGGTAIDIDRSPDNQALDNYIIKNGVYVGNRGNGDRYMLLGRAYEKEDSRHWHTF